MAPRSPLLFFSALALFAAAASACPCSAGQFCLSWRRVMKRCYPIPAPNPACTCTAQFLPVCCRVSVRRAWFFVWKGSFQASNPCQCACRSGAVCSTPPPPPTPIPISPPKFACTKEYVPVCCKVGANAPKIAPNKCVCTNFRSGIILPKDRCNSQVKAPTGGAILCPGVFQPVCCGIPGKSAPETASNECVCTKQKLGQVEGAGECKTPPGPPTPPGDPAVVVVCPTVFTPVCCKIPGKAAPQTASNECVCTKQLSGSIEARGECAKPKICPQILDPVCCLAPGEKNPTTANNECECGAGRVVMKGRC